MLTDSGTVDYFNVNLEHDKENIKDLKATKYMNNKFKGINEAKEFCSSDLDIPQSQKSILANGSDLKFINIDKKSIERKESSKEFGYNDQVREIRQCLSEKRDKRRRRQIKLKFEDIPENKTTSSVKFLRKVDNRKSIGATSYRKSEAFDILPEAPKTKVLQKDIELPRNSTKPRISLFPSDEDEFKTVKFKDEQLFSCCTCAVS